MGENVLAAIISGDDFGLAPAINAAIVQAHTQGCLTSASLSVAGPAAEEAAAIARQLPTLGLGLHLTLTDEYPVSPPASIPSLIDRNGKFFSSSAHFAARWMTGWIEPQHVRREIRSQLERTSSLGLRLTHLDGHDHLHVLPGVFEIVLDEMTRVGVHTLRIPLETTTIGSGAWPKPEWPRRIMRAVLNCCSRRAARIARQAGVVFPQRFIGFFGAGHMTPATLLDRLDTLTPGVTEIALHPAVGSSPPRPDFAGWGYRWDGELAALIDAQVQARFKQRGIQRIHFGQLEQ